MVSRLDRNQQILDPVTPRVDDEKTQRALDALQTSVRALVKFLIPLVQPEKWKALPFYDSTVTNFSADYQPCQYRKDPLGRVWVRGEMTHTGLHPAGHHLAVLPLGYRPAKTIEFLLGDGAGGTGQLIEVTPTGEINHLAGGAARCSLYISFDPEE